MRLHDLIPMLQVASGPVILISGVGLLLLSMTNRFGRVIDRARQLAEARRKAGEEDRPRIDAELGILWRRAHLVRSAISFAAASVLLAAVLVISLFLGSMLDWEISMLLALLFSACLAAVVLSLVYFLLDINLSLRALALEIPAQIREPRR